MIEVDIAIVGAGIAGAGLAAMIAPHVRVVMLEAEDQPGYHSTGRSAAFWEESYGGPGVQPLTSASRDYLEQGGFLSPRGSLHIVEQGDQALLEAHIGDFAGTGVEMRRHYRAGLEAILPGLRPEWVAGVEEPTCRDIDVAALHGHFLREARRGGAELLTRARLIAAERDGDVWRLRAGDRDISASILVNAAGAWADDVARLAGAMPVGIQPYRRTIAQLRVDPPVPADMPLIMGVDGSFYFKPDAGGRLWLSPHDETPCDPCDAAPEEIDIALAIARMEQVVDWRVLAVERKWAGLRSFAPDRLPVIGFDPACAGFFWFAGQGGFGIQTAPAASMLGAALLTGRAPAMALTGIDAAAYAPGRFATAVAAR